MIEATNGPTPNESVLVISFDRHGFAGACLQVLLNDGRIAATPRLSRSVGGYTLEEALENLCKEVAVYGWPMPGSMWVRSEGINAADMVIA